MEIGYCYLTDAIGIEFKPELYNSKDNKVGDRDYKDPDAYSVKLYSDLAEKWELQRDRFNLVDGNKRRYSSDFIGPSRAWSSCIMSDKEIGEYLLKARTFGGHMIWPLNGGKRRTINMARGGGNSLYDRIDLALAEIRNYFLGKKSWFRGGLRTVIEKEREWLEEYGRKNEDGLATFKKFIDSWHLNSFISGVSYEVISLAKSELKQDNKELDSIVFVAEDEAIFPGNEKNLSFRKIKELDKHEDKDYVMKLKHAYMKYKDNNLIAIERRNISFSESL